MKTRTLPPLVHPNHQLSPVPSPSLLSCAVLPIDNHSNVLFLALNICYSTANSRALAGWISRTLVSAALEFNMSSADQVCLFQDTPVQRISWCAVECSIDSMKLMGVAVEQAPPPPLTILSLSIITLLNTRSRSSEVCFITSVFWPIRLKTTNGFRSCVLEDWSIEMCV